MYLKGDLLRLRSFTDDAADRALLERWMSDSSAWTQSSVYNPLSPEYIRNYIQENTDSILSRRELSLVIETLESGEAVGNLQLHHYDPVSRRAGLGLYIDPEYRRRGYALETVRLTECYAFDRLGLHLLYADVLAGNVPCCRLFDRLGYQLVATLPDWEWADGAWQALNYYTKYGPSDR